MKNVVKNLIAMTTLSAAIAVPSVQAAAEPASSLLSADNHSLILIDHQP